MKIGDLVRFNWFAYHDYCGKVGMIIDLQLSGWRGKEPDPELTAYKVLLEDQCIWVPAAGIKKLEETE